MKKAEILRGGKFLSDIFSDETNKTKQFGFC